MKNFLWVTLFILVGLYAAIIIGFNFQNNEEQLAFDDEQAGLNEQIIIKFSHVVAENTPKGLAAQKFAKLVKEKTNNRVKVEVFANGSLYSDIDELEALQNGNVHMIAPATSKLTSLVPEIQVLDLPYAFPTYKAIDKAFKGAIGEQLFSKFKKENIKGMAFWSNGFKQVTSNKRPLISPEDFAGQHFRIMPNEVIEAQFKTLQARTSKIAFNKTYRQLELTHIDGQENTLSNIYSKKFYEVQSYLTISNHGFLSYAVIMNKDFWDSLPSNIQISIQEAMEETTRWNRTYAIIMNEKMYEKINKLGTIEIYELSNEEKEKWSKKFQPVYEQFKPIIGEGIMEELQRIRASYGLYE
jgi:C4-dicarboxylate-binding protein DctP